MLRANKKKQPKSSSADNTKGIENPKIALHCEAAVAKNHPKAAKHHKDGKHKKAFERSIKVYGHNWFARKNEMKDAEQHAMTKYHNDLISHVLI